MTFCLTSYARGNEFKHHIPEHDSIVITSDVASEAKCLYYEHSSTFTKKLELLNTDILLHSWHHRFDLGTELKCSTDGCQVVETAFSPGTVPRDNIQECIQSVAYGSRYSPSPAVAFI